MNNYTFDEIEVGLEGRFSATLSEKMIMDFDDISGDTNPLHTDNNYAQSKGFKDCVVYGMLTSAFYSTLVGMHLPGKHAILQGINIQFTKPVFIGDQLNIVGNISFINEAFKVIEIKAKIINQDNEKVSAAKITVGMFQ
jgi:3-hydroxybutyryl-CoA dehydratase